MDALTPPQAAGPQGAVNVPLTSAKGTDASVSVLMPTFNRAGYIGEAIASVLAQSHAPHQILILDDGSTDETADVVAGFGEAVEYIRISDNQGKSAAINRGLARATGAYIWVMDDDDVAPADALETLLAPMRADARIGFTYGRLLKFAEAAGGRKVFAPADAEPPSDPRPLFVRLMEDCFITGQPCALFRRECFDAIGTIDETVLASVDYNILLQVARRFEAADVSKVVLWQRQHFGARGPAGFRYRSQQRVKTWMAFDQRLLGSLLPQLALEEFLPKADGGRPLSTIERRRALFQKASIAGRKDLWEIAVVSLAAACAQDGHADLEAIDQQILSKMLGSRYGIDALLGDRRVQRQLAAAAGGGEVGDAIRTAIASLLPFWIGQALRRADLLRAATTAAALYRIAGPRLSSRLALQVVAKRIRGLVS
jgi:hypothetical protein